jgi:hydroxymethylbilane synthase
MEREVLASFGGGCHQKIGIAMMARPYGHIKILKGLTDSGTVLDEKTLTTVSNLPKFYPEKMWSAEINVTRKPLEGWSIPTETQALYVSRSEAWPEHFNFKNYVWAAGLKTWKNLAQKGIWVHGTSESLGEREHAQIEILAHQTPGSMKWAKLTHDAHLSNENQEIFTDGVTVIPTYSLEIQDDFNSCKGKESFYWNSGSQFLTAAQQLPEILEKQHACGPGNTFEIIRKHLEENNKFDQTKLRIFLDQDDWRKQCTQM